MKKSELKALIREVVEVVLDENKKNPHAWIFAKKEGMPYSQFVKQYKEEIDDAMEDYYDKSGGVRDRQAALEYAVNVVSKENNIRLRGTPPFDSSYIEKPRDTVKIDTQRHPDDI